MKKITLIIYLPQTICNWLFGENHPLMHRVVFGLIISIIGTVLAREFEHLSNQVLSFTGDLTGMGLHGIGFTPIIERMAKRTTA